MKTSSQPNTNRYGWIDYARGIAIALVVYRHSFEGIKRAGFSIDNYLFLEHANIIFFSFRMPLFFIVSGIFVTGSLAKRGLFEFFINKCKVILYPYFLWGSLQVTLQLIFGQYLSAPRDVSHYLYLFYVPREIEQFWYLYALFNVMVLYAFVKVKLKLAVQFQIILGFAMYLFSAYTSQHQIDLGFVNDILHYYLFFAVGDALANYIRSSKNESLLSSYKLFFILLPFFVVSQVYFLLVNLNHGSDKYLYVEYYQPIIYILIAFIGCAFVVNISFILQKKNKAVLLRQVGLYSLYIYVCHVMVTSSTRILASKVLHIDSVPVLLAICFFMGISIPILVYRVSKKLNMTWLFSLEKEKLQKKIQPANLEKQVVSVS